MDVRKRRLTLGRMMAVIAIVALGFAMTRVDAAPAVSLCVFAGCTWYLAVRRFNETLARRAAEGAATSPGAEGADRRAAPDRGLSPSGCPTPRSWAASMGTWR